MVTWHLLALHECIDQEAGPLLVEGWELYHAKGLVAQSHMNALDGYPSPDSIAGVRSCLDGV